MGSKQKQGEDVILDVPVKHAGESHAVGEKITVRPHVARWLVDGKRAHRPQKAATPSQNTTSESEVKDDE